MCHWNALEKLALDILIGAWCDEAPGYMCMGKRKYALSMSGVMIQPSSRQLKGNEKEHAAVP